jgi:hypothetical protein
VISWKLRSSIGAAFCLVSPKSWDKTVIPARQSSLTDARARRVAAEDLGAAAAGSGVDDGDGA